MKTISVSVSAKEYEAFRLAAKRQRRSIDQLIREAMALYRQRGLAERTRLTEFPILSGHRPLGALPRRAQVHNEILDE